MLIEIIHSPGALWRCHDDLAVALGAAGYSVRRVEAGTQQAAGGAASSLALLLDFEALVYGLGARAPVLQLPAVAAEAAADLRINLTGGQLTGVDGIVLEPHYDGSPFELAAFAALLGSRAPAISLLARDFSKGEKLESRNVAEALPALEEPDCLSLSLRRLSQHLCRMILGVLGPVRVSEKSQPFAHVPARRPALRAAAPIVFGISTLLAKIAQRLTRLAIHSNHWRVGWRKTQGDGVASAMVWPSASYAWLADDRRRFYADPFLFGHEGRMWLFAEEYPYATRKGLISAVEVGPDGPVGSPRIVLEQPYHLSYPNVFRRSGQIWMIPETHANGTIELYRAEHFPDRWVLESILVDKITCADATLAQTGDTLWMFAAISEGGASSWDALALFSAKSLTGPWMPHPANPVLVDARAARPAGQMFRRDGALWRPAQDCTKFYGSAITLCRVDQLDMDGYSQSAQISLAPPQGSGLVGAHTLNESGGFEVVDCVGPQRRFG